MAEVVLFDPDFFGFEKDPDSENFRFNIGLLTIGSYLKYQGIPTTVYYKSRYYLKNLPKIITPEVKLVGISVMTVQLDSAMKLAKKIKKLRPDLPIVVGGCHVRLFTQDVIKHREFDIIVPGGGEITMAGIFKAISNAQSLRKVKGLGFRQNGKVIWTGPQEDIDVKLLPKMDYSIMDHFSLIKWYDGQKSMYVYSGTGCPFHCTFCVNSISSRKFQQRKISDVVDEIEMLINEYRISHVYPIDEFFCANHPRLLEFLDLIEKRKLHFTWFIQNRADTVVPDRLNNKILKRMRRLGCVMMLLGVESGSDEMLERMQKKLKVKQAIQATKNLLKAGIIPWLSFMIGMPQETEKDYLATLGIIHQFRNLSQDTVISGPTLYRPIAGSLMYDKAIAFYPKNTKIHFSLQSDFVHTSLPNSLQAKACDYRWIDNKKILYDVLVCIERFYKIPGLSTAWINLGKSIFLLVTPRFFIKKIDFLNQRIPETALNDNVGHLKYYLNSYFYQICYFFPWGHHYLLKRGINPESFHPLLWFKWKALLRRL